MKTIKYIKLSVDKELELELELKNKNRKTPKGKISKTYKNLYSR